MRVEPSVSADAGVIGGGRCSEAFSGRPARQRLTAERHGAGLAQGAPAKQRMLFAAANKAKTDE